MFHIKQSTFLLLVVTILVIIFSIIITLSQKTDRFENNIKQKQVPGKTIWLLWLQGWEDDNVPWLVKQVRKSWEILNPTWNIELVSNENLEEYIDVPPYLHRVKSSAAKSDIIRLSLLATHGGVWADATLLCMMSLDDWLFDAIQPTGFWMYHGRDYGKGPASWFIISQRQSYIIKKWKEECDLYWSNRTEEHDYFWMDEIFTNLYKTSIAFAKEWDNVPYLWCEAIGQSHMLAGKVFDDTPDLKHILRHNPPYVLKLSHHGFGDPNINTSLRQTNAYTAIEIALTQERVLYPLHKMLYKPVNSNIFTSEKVLVVADCYRKKDVLELHKYCVDHAIQLIVYDKCNFCKHLPGYIYCRPLKNEGRENGTYLHFITTFYDVLPKYMFFLASNLEKHPQRIAKLELMNEQNKNVCYDLEDYNFTLDVYEGKPLKKAYEKNLGIWFEKYIGPWQSHRVSAVCWEGTVSSTRENIHKRPLQYYLNIYDQFKNYDNSEVGHFAERSIGRILNTDGKL